MEKVLHPYDKERMRLAMLKHEETFREQVHELHRLYRIQKMLMGSVNIGPVQQKQNTFLIHHQNHQQQPQKINGGDHANSKNNVMVNRPDEQAANMIKSNGQEQHVTESNGNMLLDENEIELTLSLGPSAHNPRRRKTDGYESGQTHSSSSTGSNQSRKISPKNSINSIRDENNNINNNNNNQFSTWGSSSLAQGSETKPGLTNGQKNNPPWLYHALSLKLT